ncbi:MAG: hypothetical protein AAF938_23755 [Myxococcota bacterium]
MRRPHTLGPIASGLLGCWCLLACGGGASQARPDDPPRAHGAESYDGSRSSQGQTFAGTATCACTGDEPGDAYGEGCDGNASRAVGETVDGYCARAAEDPCCFFSECSDCVRRNGLIDPTFEELEALEEPGRGDGKPQ